MLKFIKQFKGQYSATTQGVIFNVVSLDSGTWAMSIDGDSSSDWSSQHDTKKEAVNEANRLVTNCIEKLTLEFGV